MTRRLHRWACVLLCTLFTSIGLQAEESSQPSSTTSEALRTVGTGVITMTTTKAVGEKITLFIEANGNVTIEGVKDRKGSTYILTSQTVIIRGDVTKLNVLNNQLTNLDASGCTTLTSLKCSGNKRRLGNKLTSLDVSGCTALIWLYCDKNQLTALDVSGCTALTELYCNNNQLTALDVSGCTALTELDCFDNKLTSLDVSQNTALTKLNCWKNPLTKLDVSQNTALTKLVCAKNQLAALDVSQNTALTWLYCNDNQLTALDVSQNTALTELGCQQNQLTALDLSQNTALTELDCQQNQLAALDVSQNTALKKLKCSNNPLTALNVSKNTALTQLDCDNNQLTMLDVSQNTALTWLKCDNNPLTKLDVTKNTALEMLFCSYNQLTTLDVSQNTALIWLKCFENKLAALDVSQNTALTWLDCDNNQLTKLDVSQNTALRTLECHRNQLTALDVSKNTKLEVLRCHGNQIKGEEMTRLVNSLPDRTGKRAGKFTVVQEPALEGNICLKSDVAIAKGKNWNTQKYKSDTDEYVAYEGAQTLKVTLTKEGEGTLTATGATDLNAVPEGTELTIVATPAEGYKLTALTANGTDILATKKLSVREDTEIKATFTKKTFAVKLTKEGEGTITATGADDLNAVTYGTELTIVATPADGYKLTALTANGTDILATKKLSVREDTEIKATFTKKTFAVKLTKEGEGTITATGADDLNAVNYGTELTINATPAEGYKLTALTANGTDIL
ncbi:leucine-rich repeat domain-containing protein, partial [uncultured Porphyromonas sp.]|uniref:leucine-rich repeat domain-containing protein n=1 Tax=uncultured Porphyromonas sp. TaxID=159274 RepID=UPI002804F54E